MTWGGGKPHTNVGDKGQRYEVRYHDEAGAEKVFGWSDNRRGVVAMADSIALHPSMSLIGIFDRTTGKRIMLHDVVSK